MEMELTTSGERKRELIRIRQEALDLSRRTQALAESVTLPAKVKGEIDRATYSACQLTAHLFVIDESGL